ncbi:MAG TPA: amidohydrolase family protein, partial [Woeseiaceae bacterium]|nr:amidohydrolase family protein [Woeseiaceae bacterium]
MRNLALLVLLVAWNDGIAQDLVITNARIIDGTGRSLERGSIVVKDGRIVTVSGEVLDLRGTPGIDARGMTVLPGLIDTHRHDLMGDLQGFSSLRSDADVTAAIERETRDKLQALLSEGFTTVMMPGVFLAAGLEIRRLLEEEDFQGPRLLFSGPGFTAPDDFPVRGMVCRDNAYCAARVAFQVTDPEAARAHVRELSEAGVDGIKVFVDAEGADLVPAVLSAIADEAELQGLPTMLHAHRVEDMLAGVGLGATRLVHTPGDALIADGPGARILQEADVAIATTVSFSSPQFARAAGFEYTGAARHDRLLRNVRHLFDEGIVVAFGTDSPDFIRPMVEIEQLNTVLTP